MKQASEKDWNSIESSWRKKMQEDRSPVPEALWGKLAERLDAEEKPKVFLFKAWPWAAVLVLALGIGWQWFLPSIGEVAQSGQSSPKSPLLQSSANQQLAISKNPSMELNEETEISRSATRKVLSRETDKKIVDLGQPIQAKEEVVMQQNTPLLANLSQDKGEEKEEAVWLKVEIDPVVQVSEQENEATLAEIPRVKKRSFGQLIKKIKQVIKGNPGEWSEVKENFHLVAHKYIQTEETIKQKIQYQ
jgi:hypothetical protein